MNEPDRRQKPLWKMAQDAIRNRWGEARWRLRFAFARRSGKPVAVLIGFARWKTWMHDALPTHSVVFLGHSTRIRPKILELLPHQPSLEVFCWSYKHPEKLTEICASHNLPITRVEDGFLRSVGLGVNRSRPMSLAFDTRAMHFDRSKVSDLDTILNTHDFERDRRSLQLADRVMTALKDGLTKYISQGTGRSLAAELGLSADQKCILVIGQVEDDLSIKYGMEGFMNGNDFVRLVSENNPDATILYRPHPESIAACKPHYSNPADISDICHVIGPEWSLQESFAAASEAHTITSLAGLEAVVAGLTVHTYGMPFYAGWGFTIDHGLANVEGKRCRQLSPREVVAAAYVLYPRYFHPETGEPTNLEGILDIAEKIRADMLENAAAS